jgi:hypothetical protein
VVDGSGIFDAHQARHGRSLTHPTPKRQRKNGHSYGLTPVRQKRASSVPF